MNKTWHTNFFSGVVVETWRHAASPEQTRVETDFLERELHLRPGQRVLDASHDGGPFELGSQILIVVAQKQ